MKKSRWNWGQPLSDEQVREVYDLLQRHVTLDPDDGWEGEKLVRARDRVQAFAEKNRRLPRKDETTEFEADAMLFALDLF
ncbi:MAG: hypothetical protein WAZ94_05605 [Phycisphaerales bacterium]